jgi:hypothetical protein
VWKEWNMSILIKGMEMPKNGSWKTVRIYLDGTCAIPNWQGDCTLIQGAKAAPVPPHGDLIDYDFCMKNYELLHDDDGNPVYAVRMRDINIAPTIIPAEEGET